jgi:Cu(I)/Ag(I) efflux system membrane fusion protein
MMKRLIDTPRGTALWSMLVFALLIATGCEGEPARVSGSAATETALEHAMKHADPTYVCPMHPQIVRGEPGSCPLCGMDLVVQEVSDDGADFPAVTVAAHTAHNLGLRTGVVERDTLWKYIETVGYVGYDEERLAHVHPRASGWIEKVHVRAEGERVRRGEPLFALYSPDIVAAQEELLIALRAVGQGAARDSLAESGRQRLRLLSVPEGVIETLVRSGEVTRTVPVVAPRDGVVTAIGFRDGMYVVPADELYTIADLSSVWVQVDVFEHQLEWVQPGRPAEMRVAALPGGVWEGEVDYVYPVLDAETRTLRVRLRFPNEAGRLKPNMLADVAIYGGPRRDALTIPREAVIPAAEGARVVRRTEDGRYQPVPVVLGMQAGEQVEILSGLEEGDVVVLSGQFMIDSESNLQASFRRLSGGGEAPAAQAGHKH